MVRIGQLVTDPEKEREGVWLAQKWAGVVRAKLRRSHSEEMTDWLREQGRNYRGLDAEELDKLEAWRAINREAYARFVLEDVEGLEDGNDEPMGKTVESRVDIFRRLPDFYAWVVVNSAKRVHFLAEEPSENGEGAGVLEVPAADPLLL